MAFQLSQLTDKVRQILGGVQQQAPQYLNQIGNFVQQGLRNAYDNKGFVQGGRVTFQPVGQPIQNAIRTRVIPQVKTQAADLWQGLNEPMDAPYTRTTSGYSIGRSIGGGALTPMGLPQGQISRVPKLITGAVKTAQEWGPYSELFRQRQANTEKYIASRPELRNNPQLADVIRFSDQFLTGGITMGLGSIGKSKGPLQGDDIKEIGNVARRASLSWMEKGKVNLQQFTRDLELVDTILREKYKAPPKELKLMKPLEKIKTLFKIAAEDYRQNSDINIGLQAKPKGGTKAILEAEQAKSIPKELEPLAKEARKYKSAEEFVKGYENKLKNFDVFDDKNWSGLQREPANDLSRLHRNFMEVAQDPKYQQMYGKGLKDTDVLKDIYTQATKGVPKNYTPLKIEPQLPAPIEKKMLPGKYVARTPKEAIRLFKKTGVMPEVVENKLKSSKGTIITPHNPTNEELALSYLQKQKRTTLTPQQIEARNKLPAIMYSTKPPGRKGTIKIGDIEKIVYGSETPSRVTLGGAKKGAGLISNTLRSIESGASNIVEKGLQHPNPVIRNVSRLMQGFGGGLGKSREISTRTGQYRGSVDYATKLGGDVQSYVYKLVNKNEKSLEKIHAVLDPELSTTKVDINSLTPQEKEAVGFLRTVSDFINDTNYQNGFISKELWQKNRGGKYIARAYEPFDFPPEVADFIKQSKLNLDLNPFKQRTNVNDWKQANAIRDPAYLVAKRIQQTLFNDELLKMFNDMRKTPYVSDIPKPGFVQLSDHKGYGELAGRYVRKDIMDDIKGFFYTHDVAQKLYDVLTWYDRNPIRQGYKKLITVMNPAVRLGNNIGNYMFAWLGGINPATFLKNRSWANREIQSNGQIYRRMIKDGLLGTDTTKADITKFATEISRGIKDKNILRKFSDSLDYRYGNADDVSKLSAMKTWLDRGYSYEEAARRVNNHFQNYRTVGWLYDIGAKIPVFGNPFVRFQGDLMRMLKNAVIDHPIRTATTLMGWKLFVDVMSRISSETPEERQVRENRVGSPHIPFTNISLAVQTPYGEVNAARLLGLAAYTPVGGQSIGSDLGKLSPFQTPSLRNLSSSPDIGPILGLLSDTDFRGKKISDPNYNKYQGSLLTPEEQNINRAKYLAQSYTPPLVKDLGNVKNAFMGEKDFYGRTITPGQSLMRLGGVKVEKYGPQEVQQQVKKDQEYKEYKNEAIDKSISAISKQYLQGKITKDQAINRINYFTNTKQETPTIRAGQVSTTNIGNNALVIGNEVKILASNGNLKTIDLSFQPTEPKFTGNTELDKQLLSKYKGEITKKKNDIEELYLAGIIPADEAEKQLKALSNIQAKYAKPKKPKKLTIKILRSKTPKKINIKVKVPKIPKARKLKLTFKKMKSSIKIKV